MGGSTSLKLLLKTDQTNIRDPIKYAGRDAELRESQLLIKAAGSRIFLLRVHPQIAAAVVKRILLIEFHKRRSVAL